MSEKIDNVVSQAAKYDAVPYPSYPYANTHPDRLYTIGKLFGMEPVSFENCKVLELGCASGGNIISMATLFPESTFVGVDVSEVQIKQGQEHIKNLGIKNVTLKVMSITDINAKFGKFDYIIAHGLLSWVPKNVQEKIFDVFSKNLNKNGIAYVSYNTLPGWNAVKSVREMMLYHTKGLATPEEKVMQARLLLKFITEANVVNKTPYAQSLDNELEVLKNVEDAYLLYDYLEEDNEPFYFYQVVENAVKKDLQYIGDTNLASMFVGNFASSTAEVLSQAGNDAVRIEQYMDFIRNRRFRTTLFCHKDVVLNRNLQPSFLQDFYLSLQINSNENLNNIDLTKHQEVVINFGGILSLTTSNAAVIIAIKILSAQNGKPISTKELLNKVFDTVGPSANKESITNIILEQILRLVLADAVGISAYAGKFVAKVTDKPKVSELARYQASSNEWITNQRAERNNIDLFNRVLIQYLNGSNDINVIIENMVKHVENDELIISVDGKKVSGKQQIREAVATMTKQNIENLAPRALLVA